MEYLTNSMCLISRGVAVMVIKGPCKVMRKKDSPLSMKNVSRRPVNYSWGRAPLRIFIDGQSSWNPSPPTCIWFNLGLWLVRLGGGEVIKAPRSKGGSQSLFYSLDDHGLHPCVQCQQTQQEYGQHELPDRGLWWRAAEPRLEWEWTEPLELYCMDSSGVEVEHWRVKCVKTPTESSSHQEQCKTYLFLMTMI